MCPGFYGVGSLGLHADDPQERSACPGVTRLSSAARSLTCSKPGVPLPRSRTTCRSMTRRTYTWRRESLIDAGQEPGLTSVEKARWASARRRIAELEMELAIHQRATELLKEAVRPQARFAAMVWNGLPIQTVCRILEVSDRDCTAWRPDTIGLLGATPPNTGPGSTSLRLNCPHSPPVPRPPHRRPRRTRHRTRRLAAGHQHQPTSGRLALHHRRRTHPTLPPLPQQLEATVYQIMVIWLMLLRPALEREIPWRLLGSEQTEPVRQIGLSDSRFARSPG